MNKKKYIVGVIGICLFIFIGTFSLKARASAVVSGDCGENLTWIYDDLLETLTISGTGDMDSYDSEDAVLDGGTQAPWHAYITSRGKNLTVQVGEGVTSIGKSAFEGGAAIKKVGLPSTIESIDNFAFAFCKNLRTISFPYGLNTIGIRSFYDCENLDSIQLPDSVTKVGNYAFAFAKGATALKLSASMQVISMGTFFQCEGIKEAAFPTQLTAVRAYAFGGCKQLTKIVFPETVTKIGTGAFSSTGNELQFYGYADTRASRYAQAMAIPFISMDAEILDLTVSEVLGDRAKLSFTGLPGVMEYSLYCFNETLGVYEFFTDITATEYLITGLSSGQSTRYKIRTSQRHGTFTYFGKFSNEAVVTTLADGI
ncbi:MAG: leucine-rich repeat domain-containing protein [Lachnospiraceae bacterium]